MQGIQKNLNGSDVPSAHEHNVVRECQVGKFELRALRMKVEIFSGCLAKEEPGKILNAKHKNKGRDGVTLTKALSTQEVPIELAINAHREGSGGDGFHDPKDEPRGEIQPLKDLLDEVPGDRVKSFSEIHFQQASWRSPSLVVFSQ